MIASRFCLLVPKQSFGTGKKVIRAWLILKDIPLQKPTIWRGTGHAFALAQALTRRGLLFFSAPCD